MDTMTASCKASSVSGASIPMGRGTCPPNILQVMSFRISTRVTATVVCCILMQILCVVSQKNFSFWGTLSPRPPTGALPLDPTGGLRPQPPYRPSTGAPPLDPALGLTVPQTPSLLLCPPNNPVRSTPLISLLCGHYHIYFCVVRKYELTTRKIVNSLSTDTFQWQYRACFCLLSYEIVKLDSCDL